MLTDKELLEMAAKAEGRALKYMTQHMAGREPEEFIACWNPLTDDGDALRLAVSTGLISSSGHQTYVADTDTWHAWAMTEDELFYEAVTYSKSLGDACAATRRAIVLSAAKIGASHWRAESTCKVEFHTDSACHEDAISTR